ncbi:MAG: hypothetical protein AB1714_24440 [Acidobacteriota bacterium]
MGTAMTDAWSGFRVVFRTELRRQLRRALPYALLVGLVVLTVIIHTWLRPSEDWDIDVAPEAFAQPQIIAALLLLELGALVLTLPLLARDRQPGAQEAVLQAGVSETAYVLAKFSAVQCLLAALVAAHAIVVSTSCWMAFGRVGAADLFLSLGVITIPAVFLCAAAGLFVGSLARHILTQLLGLFGLAAGVYFVVQAAMAGEAERIGAILLDLNLRVLGAGPLDWAAVNWSAEHVLNPWFGFTLLSSYELAQIVTQRVFLAATGILLIVIACGLTRSCESDHHRLWKSELPFHTTLHRFLLFEGRGAALWASLLVAAVMPVALGGWIVKEVMERKELWRELKQQADADLAAPGRPSARIESIAIDITLGTRLRPISGTCEYVIETSGTTDLVFVLNSGLRVPLATIDGRGVEALRRSLDRILIRCDGRGRHRVRLRFEGFIDNYYRAALGRFSEPALRWYAGMYYYHSEAPAVTHTASSYCWFMPDDHWFPLLMNGESDGPVECAATVTSPGGWQAAFPGFTTNVENSPDGAVYRYKGTYGPSELGSLSIAAGALRKATQQVGERQVEIYYPPGCRIDQSELPEKLADIAAFLNDIDDRPTRPVQAIAGKGDLAVATLFMPFRAQEVRVTGWPLLIGVEWLMPAGMLCGPAATHPFYNTGLRDCLGAFLRTEQLGAWGHSVRGANPVVPRVSAGIERGMVLAQWEERARRDKRVAASGPGQYSEKASRLLTCLSTLLGHDRFHACVRRLFREHRFRHTTPDDFIEIVNEEAHVQGQDLSWFWEDYYQNARLPHYRLSHSPVAWRFSNGKYHARAAIANDWDGRMIVPATITMEGDTWHGQVFVDHEAVLEVDLSSRPIRIDFDPKGQIYRSDAPAGGTFEIVDQPRGVDSGVPAAQGAEQTR